MSKVRIGIAGATGYGGQELLRLAARHPNAHVTVAMASSATEDPRSLPTLTGVWSGEIVPLSIETLAQNTDAVFLALPEPVSAKVLPLLSARVGRIFDLSGAFRLRDVPQRARWYPDTPEFDFLVTYGLTERYRDSIAQAAIVACPGCYPTAALLALEPLVTGGLIEGDVIIDARSGISGAGKKPSERTHFSECHGSVAAYNVFAHRHTAEIEQELSQKVTFVPHLVPLDRGLLTTIYTRVRSGTTEKAIHSLYLEAYGNTPFVRLRESKLPEIKHVTHTNFCDIGWTLDSASDRLVLVSCLDNLVKGAAGQAIQNFNIAFGFDEQAGLV